MGKGRKQLLSWMLIGLTTCASLLALTTAPAAAADGIQISGQFPFVPSTQGNFPISVAYDPATGNFYTTGGGDGSISIGNLRVPAVTPFLAAGLDGRVAAAGIKVQAGRLFVMGFSGAPFTGPPGLWVYDLRSKALIAKFAPEPNGWFNNAVITRNGDVFVSDTAHPIIWRFTAAQIAGYCGTSAQRPRLNCTPEQISTSPEISAGAQIDALVTFQDTRSKLVLLSVSSGTIWRITFNDRTNLQNRQISTIQVPGLAEYNGGFDDPTLDSNNTLVVADRGWSTTDAGGKLLFIQLAPDASTGALRDVFEDPQFMTPTGVELAGCVYLVPNSHLTILPGGTRAVQNPPWQVLKVTRPAWLENG